jgi:hypothetical protein
MAVVTQALEACISRVVRVKTVDRCMCLLFLLLICWSYMYTVYGIALRYVPLPGLVQDPPESVLTKTGC